MLFKANKKLKLHRISCTSLAFYIPKQEGFAFSFQKAGCNGRNIQWASTKLRGALGITCLPGEAESDLFSKASWLNGVIHSHHGHQP